MRWVGLLVASATVASAAPPGGAVRKPLPAASERLDDLVDAIVADKAGDYRAAYQHYTNDPDDADIPAVAYNVADLLRRMERYKEAIASYQKYLALSPKAPDRAQVERLIDQLAKTPASLVVDGEDLDAVVYLDGQPLGSSPVTTTLGEGFHVIDRIGPRSFRHEALLARPLADHHVTSNEVREGNVVISASIPMLSMPQVNSRFQLPPGHIDTAIGPPGYACSRLVFDAPARGVVYVFIDGPRQAPENACRPVTVRVHTVAFPGGAR